MVTYRATSLEDIARMFDQHALDALRSSENAAIKVNARRLAAREAAIWKLAAATVRDTSIGSPVAKPFSCLRCVTPAKCGMHGCSPGTWPAEQRNAA